ncbi:autotransporter assembly complex protein TamA [Maritimibacter dapengensis]|uniref:BamA/TamA family outer membrane protein n=1 Tax=Maritimibacter dapengensis TaxID=2836868 RepID=A0ABS6SZA4_9RHOB|nr:BamA/TamA family outer membrane protein [Maritimibacter dapengensis]MBV7377686.1 BamA/TamA family outer membrane protein [Maritimibacter dapengensis]
MPRVLAVVAVMLAHPAMALDELQFNVTGDDRAIEKELEGASLLVAAEAEGRTNSRDLIAAARAEYERLVNALYGLGYYGPVVRVNVDGREAANIPTYRIPRDIRRITVNVDPGRQFVFGEARVVPLPRGAEPTDGFERGEPARATVIRNAAADGVEAWRNRGRAKAEVSDQSLVADHATGTMNARIGLAPGPVVRLGTLRQVTPSYVRATRIQRIAGLPTGEVFSPEALDRSAERLRRTGAFASVVLREGPLKPDGTMDIELAIDDMKPRRFGFGAEVSSLEGAGLSAFWMHRNLLGGAERFRVDGAVSGLTPNLGNLDVEVGARLDIPAAFGTDTDAYVMAEAAYLREPTFSAYQGEAGVGVHRYFTDDLEGEIGFGYMWSRVTDSQGTRTFSILKLPASVTFDRRDDPLDATRGYYIGAELEPHYDLNAGPGVWGMLDGRVYTSFGEDDVVTLAARFQIGTVVGQPATSTHPEYLFYSGGGGTVRGQPYQSLAFPAGGGDRIGGQAFVGAQFEVRYDATDKIGLVGFFDVGYLGASGFFDPVNTWHSGAGVGVRYDTGLGPIRFDVGLPVTNGPGGSLLNRVQLYIGIGQSF